MTTLTILTLRVPAGRTSAVVDYYESARILERSGAAHSRLCVSAEDSSIVIIIAEWPDPAAYTAWQASKLRAEFSRGVQQEAGPDVSASSEVFQVAGT